MKQLSILLFGVLIISSNIFAQENKALDSYLEQAVKDYDLPGLSISLVNKDAVYYKNAFGYKKIETKDAIDTKSVFAIASLSKAFTAAAIGMLVDEGKLDWNDRVVEHLPIFALSDEYVASQMTVEDLLCHRSGFDTFDGDLLWYGSNYSREEIIKRFSKYELSYDHRTNYGYQNIMFIVAGEIVAKLSGMSWEEFIQNRFFQPLEMNNSYSTFAGFEGEENKALPYVQGSLDEIRNYDNSGGAAAISSNVEDLSHWIQMWLNDGIYNGDTLLQAATVRKLLDLHTPISPSSFDRSNGIEFKGYAQGWFLMDYKGAKVAHHGGGLPGYISKIFIVPSEGIGGIILTNGETSLPNASMYKAIDMHRNTPDAKDWAAIYLNFKKRYEAYLDKKVEERNAMRNAKLKSNVDKQLLLGEYEDKVYGKATVSMKDGKLIFSMLPAKEIFTSEMTHWQQNTYEIIFKDKFLPNGYVTFDLDANGKVAGLKVELPNPDFHFYKLDFKRLD